MAFIRSNVLTILILLVILGVVGFVVAQILLRGGIDRDSDLSAIQSVDTDGVLPYTDLHGEPVDLNVYAGSVLVINAWASWCPYCKEELPLFSELASEYGEDITVLAINRKESPATARAYAEYVGQPENIVFLLDAEDRFYTSIGGYAMPETVIYDKKGAVVAHKRGSMGIEEMRRLVDSALEAKPN